MQGNFIATMTVEELVLALKENGYIITRREPEPQSVAQDGAGLDFSDSSRYGRGLAAIESRYNVSHLTAQRMKNGVLSPAIHQTGARGKIWVDFEKADAILTAKGWRAKTE